MCTSWDMLFHIYFRFQATIFDSHSSRQTAVFRSVQSCFWASNIWYSRWNCGANMLQAEIYVIPYLLTVPGRRSSLICHPLWRRPVLTFVALCCSMQKICGFRWNFTYIFYLLWCRVHFRFHVGHFDFLLNSHRIMHRVIDVAISSGNFGILKSKRSNVEFSSKIDLRPLIQWSPSLSRFHQNITHTILLPVA